MRFISFWKNATQEANKHVIVPIKRIKFWENLDVGFEIRNKNRPLLEWKNRKLNFGSFCREELINDKLCEKGEVVQPVILCGQVLARDQKPINADLISDIKKANDFWFFN